MIRPLSSAISSAVFVASLIGCASHVDPNGLSGAPGASVKPGSASISGSLPGLALETASGASIVRSRLPYGELAIATTGLACSGRADAVDHVTIDLGAQTTGRFDVVAKFPSKTKLLASQARAHACPAKTQDSAPCHDDVTGGWVQVDRWDNAVGGIVEGSFEIDFTDGTLRGSFSAARCN